MGKKRMLRAALCKLRNEARERKRQAFIMAMAAREYRLRLMRVAYEEWLVYEGPPLPPPIIIEEEHKHAYLRANSPMFMHREWKTSHGVRYGATVGRSTQAHSHRGAATWPSSAATARTTRALPPTSDAGPHTAVLTVETPVVVHRTEAITMPAKEFKFEDNFRQRFNNVRSTIQRAQQLDGYRQ